MFACGETLCLEFSMSIADSLRRQPDALVFFEALLIVFAIGLLDSMGGWDVSMFLLYAFPILLVVWFSDRRWAIACGVVWFLAKKPRILTARSRPMLGQLSIAWSIFFLSRSVVRP